jgi:hypothetical protein
MGDKAIENWRKRAAVEIAKHPEKVTRIYEGKGTSQT